MSVIDNTPQNRNFQSPLNFKFTIKKAPNVNFFIQKVNIPSITLAAPIATNPFVKIPYPGDHLDYGELNITFKIDEDFQNYLEIYNWITALGKPQTWDQRAQIESQPSYTGDGIYSDISIIALNSKKIANYETVYIDAFPVSISSINFNTTDSDVDFISASATFKYTYFTISQVV